MDLVGAFLGAHLVSAVVQLALLLFLGLQLAFAADSGLELWGKAVLQGPKTVDDFSFENAVETVI